MVDANAIIQAILNHRGLRAPADIEEYLSKKPMKTYDPFLLPDMEAGVELLYAALKSGKNICVYGDYDVDGVLATALLCEYLKWMAATLGSNAEISAYIPSRFDEGYGLNAEALKSIREGGTDVVVTVDCGSVSKNAVAAAQASGLTVLVTDHHVCEAAQLPGCLVINPKRPDAAYTCAGLSGCGVAFKLAQGLRRRFFPDHVEAGKRLNACLDLVAVATIADVVPLTDENRTLVKYGLAALNRGGRTALRKLSLRIGFNLGSITAYNIAFGIAPHINAAGRMGEALPVVDLFLSQDETFMDEVIEELVRRNTDRRAIQTSILEECVHLVEECYQDDLFLLLRPKTMHEGVSGIVAGRIKGRFGKPVAVLSETEGEGERPALKGSVRSVDKVNVVELLSRHQALFEKLGGHAMAAGFILPAGAESELRQALNADMAAMLESTPDLLEMETRVDYDLSPAEATFELANRLEAFEPTGTGNLKPCLRLSGVTIRDIRRMGTEKQHLRFSAGALSCVHFDGVEAFGVHLVNGVVVDLIGHLEINHWNGTATPQFLVQKVQNFRS